MIFAANIRYAEAGLVSDPSFNLVSHGRWHPAD